MPEIFSVIKFMELMYKLSQSTDYRDEIRLQELADIANMTPTAFSRFFKLRTNRNISDYIIDVRLGHAARLLADSTMSVVEICYHCGFNNISYFNRVFRKRKDCTPTEFRANYHKRKVIVLLPTKKSRVENLHDLFI